MDAPLEPSHESPDATHREPFRVAILGTSFGRVVQTPAFRLHPAFRLIAIAGNDAAKTRRIAGELGIEGAYDDWRRLLERERPDLVSIATPVDLHHPMMLAALESGAHVLCEKPTALHRLQAAEMRDRAAALGRVAAINHEFRFFPARQHALAVVRRGGIGVPRRGAILGRHPLWTRPDTRPMTWLSDRARGGGILGALGSHHVDCLRMFFGEPNEALADVRVQQPRRGPTREDPRVGTATADDAFTLRLRFPGDATALIDLDGTTPYRWERFEIGGEEATLRWDETGYRLWRIAPGADPEELVAPPEHDIERRAGDPPLVAPFRIMVERLARALRGEAAMAPDFDDAVAVQSTLDAARESSAAGTWIAVRIPAPERHEASA